MDFAYSAKARDYLERLNAFMTEEVLPAEPVYERQLVHGADWTQWRQPPIMEELKARAEPPGCGTCSCRTGSTAPA